MGCYPWCVNSLSLSKTSKRLFDSPRPCCNFSISRRKRRKRRVVGRRGTKRRTRPWGERRERQGGCGSARDRWTSIIEVSMPLTAASGRCRQQWCASHWQPANYSSPSVPSVLTDKQKGPRRIVLDESANAGRGSIQSLSPSFSTDIAFRKGRSACSSPTRVR